MSFSGRISVGRQNDLGPLALPIVIIGRKAGVVRVLIADDDRRLGPVLVRGMATDSICADLVASGREAIIRATATDYTVIVTEITLPDVDGFEVCRTIRHEQVDAPILILSARDTVDDRVHGLDAGADDYLGKPFALRELLARLRAMSRRGRVPRGVVLSSGDLRLDSARHQVTRGDVSIDLSRTEFAVLESLMREPGRVLSRFELLERAWGYHYENRSNVVEVYIRYLREKIDRPFGRYSLQTVRGVGYRICGED
jgi:two-component system OmpR family response regulator